MPGAVERRTHSRLTFSRNRSINVSYENIEIARSGQYVNSCGQEVYVGKSLEQSMRDSIHYHYTHVFNPNKLVEGKKFETKFQIMNGSSIEAAIALSECGDGGRHVGILNSASGKTPGGQFFSGTSSQEDCICRASLLYPCLAQYQTKPNYFYCINNTQKYRGSSSSCAIFSPKVPVIRRDNVEATLLKEYLECSFVSIPSPNAYVLGREDRQIAIPTVCKHSNVDEVDDVKCQTLREAMQDHLFRALCIFEKHGCTDIVLCAFGCGIHGYSPYVVASTIKNILSNDLRGRFRTVVFAINKARSANYEAFLSVFPSAICP